MNLTPHRIPAFLPRLFPKLLWRMPGNEKTIYLTFDDGPVPGTTEFVIETLKTFQAKAAFFCIGDNINKFPEVFKIVASGGHSIGNHTFNHLKGWSTSVVDYIENITKCEHEISNFEFQTSNLFRPPYGRITLNQIKALSQFKIIMWDVLSLDYQQGGSLEPGLRGSIQATRPGSIVVFHDSYKAEKKLKYMLPRYLEHFSNLGYQFKAL